MSESTPSVVAANAPLHPSQELTSESLDSILADFRAWLRDEIAHAREGLDNQPENPQASVVDLHTLLGQFIALRHEVNLQTRAVRNQQDQNTVTLEELIKAVALLESGQETDLETEEAPSEDRLRPLLKTLVDIADAFELGRREMLRAQNAVLSLVSQANSEPAKRSWWQRLWGRAPQPDATVELGRQVQRMLDSLITGYNMSLQRIERSFAEHDLEPMQCIGERYDPEQMEVIEAVADSGKPAGEVLEEVRRGYLWRGRVFRYAVVRVARP